MLSVGGDCFDCYKLYVGVMMNNCDLRCTWRSSHEIIFLNNIIQVTGNKLIIHNTYMQHIILSLQNFRSYEYIPLSESIRGCQNIQMNNTAKRNHKQGKLIFKKFNTFGYHMDWPLWKASCYTLWMSDCWTIFRLNAI